MSDVAVKEAIRTLITEIAEDMDLDTSKITDSALFIKEIGLDSMALLEVLATLEKKFKVSIPETEFPNLSSIDACAVTVAKYQAAA